MDGEYAIAVSSFPDFEFDGGGEGGIGRYVLDVHVEPPRNADEAAATRGAAVWRRTDRGSSGRDVAVGRAAGGA